MKWLREIWGEKCSGLPFERVRAQQTIEIAECWRNGKWLRGQICGSWPNAHMPPHLMSPRRAVWRTMDNRQRSGESQPGHMPGTELGVGESSRPRANQGARFRPQDALQCLLG